MSNSTDDLGRMRYDVVMVSVDSISPYGDNPRNNDDAVDAVARSIREFGFRQPIVIDEESVIIVGHTRWKAACKLGLRDVPVHIAKDLSPEQARAYRIADNRIAAIATWDDALLMQEIDALRLSGVDLALLSFTENELQRISPELTDDMLHPIDENEYARIDTRSTVQCPECGTRFIPEPGQAQ